MDPMFLLFQLCVLIFSVIIHEISHGFVAERLGDDTARLAGILTCGYTAHPPHPKLDKTALGTLAYIPTTHFATTLEAVESLKARGIPVWGLETTSQSRNHTAVQYPRPLGLVLGNEALGVEQAVLERCDELVQIPMYGFKNSLNVAAASAVVVFEVLRQWEAQGEVP